MSRGRLAVAAAGLVAFVMVGASSYVVGYHAGHAGPPASCEEAVAAGQFVMEAASIGSQAQQDLLDAIRTGSMAQVAAAGTDLEIAAAALQSAGPQWREASAACVEGS